jgi:hypothetical protein
MPSIIVAVVVIIMMAAFYFVDRSGNTSDSAPATQSASTGQAAMSPKSSPKAKYQAEKSVFSHSGFSGSIDEYLDKAESGFDKGDASKQDHSGYAGPAKDYLKKYQGTAGSSDDHVGFSGSVDDYLKGNYDKTSNNASKSSKPMQKKATSASVNNEYHGYTGSVDDYLKKHGG